MTKFFLKILWMGVLVVLVAPQSQVYAADLNLIKSRVTKQVEERQLNSFNIEAKPKKSETTHTKTYWSALGGKLKVHSINGQYYLSYFRK